jgi:hypothetical protein
MLMQTDLNNPRSGLRRGGIQNLETLEAGSIKAAGAGQQSICLGKGMSSDQKIRRHTCSSAASLAIGLPSDSSFESSARLNRAELDLQISQCLTAGRNRGKAPGYFRPHHVAGQQSALPGGGAQNVPGGNPELGIVSQEIKEHVGIHCGNHFNGYSPRSSFMISSVLRPSFKMPNYLSKGSRGARLVITKRPRSSLTSRTWPTRIPNRTRRGLGMVICPFSETVVFIPEWYEFLLSKSNLISERRGESQ